MGLFVILCQHRFATTQLTMNSPLQFSIVALSSITHSLKPFIDTYKSSYSSRPPCSIEMRELPRNRAPAGQQHDLSQELCRHRDNITGYATTRPHEIRTAPASNPWDSSSRPIEFATYDDHYQNPATTPHPSPPDPLLDTAAPPSTNYLCTFCWRPHNSTINPSRAVGRAARLACDNCYRALLDLAVC